MDRLGVVVIALRAVANVRVDVGEDRLDHVLGRAACRADATGEALHAVLVALRIAGLDDAIAHHDEHVARVQLSGAPIRVPMCSLSTVWSPSSTPRWSLTM